MESLSTFPSSTASTPTCSNCMFWSPLQNGEGECRYNPPTCVVLPMQTLTGNNFVPVPVFPRTRPDIWCGQHASAT